MIHFHTHHCFFVSSSRVSWASTVFRANVYPHISKELHTLNVPQELCLLQFSFLLSLHYWCLWLAVLHSIDYIKQLAPTSKVLWESRKPSLDHYLMACSDYSPLWAFNVKTQTSSLSSFHSLSLVLCIVKIKIDLTLTILWLWQCGFIGLQFLILAPLELALLIDPTSKLTIDNI